MIRTALPDVSQVPLAGALRELSCCDELVPADEGFPARALKSCTIQTTIDGSAEVEVEGRPYTHRPGCLFVVARGARLAERSLKPWRVRYLMLDGPWCEPLIAALRHQGGGLMLERPPRPWRDALEDAIAAGLAGGPGSTWRIAGALATLLGGLSAAPAVDGDLLDEVGRLIDAAPERAWNVSSLARALHIRPRTLQQRFHARVGGGPARWILARRMAHARLLLQRGASVQATSERLGFANPFHFSRVFKRLCGVPPSTLLE